MANFIELWRGNGKAKRQQALKERVLKNREGVLDAMAENAKGTRACPLMMGQRCLGSLCEWFMEWKNVNEYTQKKFTYYRCAVMQMPILQIELIRDINLLRKELKQFDDHQK